MTIAYLIQVEGRGEFRCRPDQNLVEAQSDFSEPLLPSGCCGGGCGSCKIILVKGEVEHERFNSIACSQSDQEEGCILACQSFPKSDLQLRIE